MSGWVLGVGIALDDPAFARADLRDCMRAAIAGGRDGGCARSIFERLVVGSYRCSRARRFEYPDLLGGDWHPPSFPPYAPGFCSRDRPVQAKQLRDGRSPSRQSHSGDRFATKALRSFRAWGEKMAVVGEK
jgi:hypothetical protein